MNMKYPLTPLMIAFLALGLWTVSCSPAPQAPAAPTLAPQAPAAPTPAPQALAPTTAKAAEAPKPTAAPVQTSVVQPTSAPVKKTDFPQKGKTLTIIVPMTAGGSADIMVRLLAPFLEADLGVSVQVLNKGGGGTQVGTTEVALAKPDGYTMGLLSMFPAITSYMDPDRKAAYNRQSFQTVATYGFESMGIFAKSDSPYKDLRDLCAAAKANPEKVKVGAINLLSGGHLSVLTLEDAAGVKFAIPLFDGGGDANTAILGGHVDAALLGAVGAIPHVRSGAMRGLGVPHEESEFLPGVKSFADQGYRNLRAPYFGFVVPAGTPREIVDILSASVKKAVATDELKQKLFNATFTPRYMTPEEYSALWTELEGFVKPLLEKAKQQAK